MGIVVVDPGIGNVRSVARALHLAGGEVQVAQHGKEISTRDAIVLVGVGAFPEYQKALVANGFAGPLIEAFGGSCAVLGICVGMHVMAKSSSEFEYLEGFGAIDGHVVSLRELGTNNLSVPHLGWNRVSVDPDLAKDSPLWVLEGRDCYFSHSFGITGRCPNTAARSTYGIEFASGVQQGKIVGVQFHPERSQFAGLDFLRAWVDWTR